MQINAMLCDAASIREGLLFILGGGVTRVWRGTFPARFDGALALLVSVNAAEADDRHKFRIAVSDEDGAKIVEMKGEFGVKAGKQQSPGEDILVPLAVDLGLQVTKPGTFSVDVIIDGQLHRSLAFQVRPSSERPV